LNNTKIQKTSFISKDESFSASSNISNSGNTLSQSLEKSFSQVTGQYAGRIDRNKLVTSYNPSNLEQRNDEFIRSTAKPFGQKCSVSINDDDFSNMKSRFRFMFTSLDERIRAIEKHLLRMQSFMCLNNGIDESTLSPVGKVSQEEIWVCGRICCETSEGKINKSSIMLEGSKKESSGRRVLLDFNDFSGLFSIFPGQIVLVNGLNSGGYRMIVKRIITGSTLPSLSSSPSSLLNYHHSTGYQGSDPLKIMTACGPFTTSDNLNYLPLQDLLGKVLISKPDVLILVGPFVDVSQPLLSSGDVILEDEYEGGENDENDSSHIVTSQSASYEMVFTMRIIRDCLQAFFNEEDASSSLATNIILIPSLLDGHHEFVYPQPPFGDRDEINTEFFAESLGVLNIPFSKEKDPRKRIHLLSNPCMFR
jgi:DNA polymerase alpha subunit B